MNDAQGPNGKRRPESERWTRKELIDKRLTDARWKIVPEKDFDASEPFRAYNNCAIEELETDNGPADYALCADGKILSVVEAKKLTLGPQNVLSQAERYSKGLVEKTVQPPRLRRAVPVLHKRRNHLAPRPPGRLSKLVLIITS
jgi:type I site-specific restriction endonuclease